MKLSITAFTVGIITGIVSICLNMPILGVLIITYSFMQLSELIIWIGHDNDNIELNKIGTKVGKYSLPSHNIAIAVGILISYRNNLNEMYYWIPLIIGLLFYLVVYVGYYACDDESSEITKACDRTDKADNSCNEHSARLSWAFNHSWYGYSFCISLILLLIFVRPIIPSALLASIFFIVTWIVTYSLGKDATQGSYWCFSCALFIPLLATFNYLLIRKLPNTHS